MRLQDLILPLSVLLVACVGEQSGDKAPRKVRCVEVVAAADSIERVSYPAILYPAAELAQAFRVAGVVERVYVKEGDFVRRGEVIAALDRRDYKLQLDATEAEYDAVKAEVDRVVELYHDQSVAANDYDKAVSGLRRITAAREVHRNALKDTELRAEFDGYIQSVNYEAGATVAAGMAVVVMVSSSAPEVVVNIPARDMLRRAELLSAVAKIALFEPREFALSALGVKRKANLNQLYESRFQIVGDGAELPAAGMSAMVELRYRAHDFGQVLIPFSAVVERDGECFVWRVEGGVAHSVPVVVERVLASGAAVVRGAVGVGDQIISAGVASLGEGQRVEVMAAESKSNVGNLL